MDRLLKTLELVERDLGAAEAKVEIGGLPPSGDGWVVYELEPEMRLVVRFEGGVPAGAEERLAALTEGFRALAEKVRQAAPSGPIPHARRELSEALFSLAQLSGACRAVVLDERSPVLFGDSHDPEARLDVDDALHAARLARRVSTSPAQAAQAVDGSRGDELSGREWLQLEWLSQPYDDHSREEVIRLSTAIEALRGEATEQDRICERDWDVPVLARRIASIYWVLLVFTERFSEVQADGHLVHALDAIERLVASLPPIGPKGGAKARHLRPVD